MKNSSKKSLALVLLPSFLTACHLDGHVLMGGHSENSYGNGTSISSGGYCQGSNAGFSVYSNSGSTVSCQVPDENSLVSVTPVDDGSLRIRVKKLGDGSFPSMNTLSYSERTSSAPHSLSFMCTVDSTAAPTGDLQQVNCLPPANTHIRWFETSSQDVRVDLNWLVISDSACGSTKSFQYLASSCDSGSTGSSSSGSQIGSVFFPSLYLEGSPN